MNLLCKMACTAALFTALASSANAEIMYSYTDTVSTSGSVTTVSVYLSEALNGGSSFIQANNGLFGAGFGINVSNGGNAQITGATFNTAPLLTISATPSANSGFGTGGSAFGNTANVTPTNAAISESIGPGQANGFGTANLQTGTGSNLANQYLLGSFTIQAGSISTSFALTDLNASPNAALGNGNQGVTITKVNGHDLDFTDDNGSVPTGTYVGADVANGNPLVVSFTVPAAVPEPSSLLLCGLASLGGAYSVYRRRKASRAQAIALA